MTEAIFGRKPVREALVVWAFVLLALALFRIAFEPWLPWGASLTGALAVALFLWAPTEADRRAGRPDSAYGLRLRHWKKDTAFAFAVMAVIFPLFVLGFLGFLVAVDEWFPRDWARVLTPYSLRETGLYAAFQWRLPDRLVDRVAGNIAVAVAEEFFYRGYVLARFMERWPPGTRLLGGPFGRAVWLQAAIFAIGHLLTPQPFRLATFFPGLLFGWMAARSGRVVAPIIVHAAANLLIATLEASAFGR